MVLVLAVVLAVVVITWKCCIQTQRIMVGDEEKQMWAAVAWFPTGMSRGKLRVEVK